MTVIAPPGGASLMAVAAHPDDIESWCAGTLALAAAAGSAVRLLLVTSGDKGTSDRTVAATSLATQREHEARAAARVLGLREVAFLRYPDGELEDTKALRGDLVLWIRRWRPDVLFTHDPEHGVPPYFSHRDHRITGRTTLDAVYPLARDPLSFSEHLADGLTTHAVHEVWLFASSVANSCVDITASFERKLAGRLEHASQTSDPEALRQGWRTRAEAIGAPFGAGPAESFTVLHHD
ncbi:MAG: PIG-L deacetylase family protein [Dehalococcoidia bacterium]